MCPPALSRDHHHHHHANDASRLQLAAERKCRTTARSRRPAGCRTIDDDYSSRHQMQNDHRPQNHCHFLQYHRLISQHITYRRDCGQFHVNFSRTILYKYIILRTLQHFCRAMLCISATYAVMRCPSVFLCLCVYLSRSWILSKRVIISSDFFSPWGSVAISF